MSMARHTDFLSLNVGDTLPAPDGRNIWAAEWEPAWFIFTVPPRGELPASAWLARNGVTEAWYPSETILTRNRFRPGKTIPRIRPVISGYLFAVLPARPHWDVLFARSRGKLLKVVSHLGHPVAVPEATMIAMAHVPERLATIREAERRKRTIQPGDRATVSIAGVEWTVEVGRIDAGIAHFVLPLLGGREVQVSVDEMRKEPPLA